MEDPKAIAEKLFDCAESVIQEWIADYFNADISDIFDDYSDISSVIGLTHADKQYNAYVVTMDVGTASLVNADLLKDSEVVRKTCSMLFDGVYHVYSSLAMTAKDEYRERLRGLVPKFDETTMSFHLTHINVKAAELQAADEQNKRIRELVQSGVELTDEQKSSLINSAAAIKDVMMRNTREVLDAAEAECLRLNELPHNEALYIVVEEASDDNIEERLEESMCRMPAFGTMYRNPDESNFIEDLKKEHGVV
jgi:hypothetical protein